MNERQGRYLTVFLNKPILVMEGPNRWTLQEPLYYTRGELSVKIPEGFSTDLASVPRVLWPIFPPQGQYSCAAILHDYLIETEISKIRASREFFHAMIHTGTPRWQAALFALAVQLFSPRPNATKKEETNR